MAWYDPTPAEINKELDKGFISCKYASPNDKENFIIEADLNKIDFNKANKIVNKICKKFNLKQTGCGVDLTTNIRDWSLQIPNPTIDKIRELTKDKCNGDLFIEVRQRVTAYKYYREFWKQNKKDFDKNDEYLYLDDAYRFLYSSIDPYFIVFCANKDRMDAIKYVKSLLNVDEESYASLIKNKKKSVKEDPIKNMEMQLKDEISKLKAAVAGALPYLVLYDGGKYDEKDGLIDKIYKARDILNSSYPEWNEHILKMFKQWKEVENAT